MLLGGNLPVYELYINRSNGEFLTYNRNADKWQHAKLDLLDWPYYVSRSKKKWINPKGNQTIKRYLGVKEGGYEGILSYQQSVRRKELERRYRLETDPWDEDLAQTPELPKDWERWVSKGTFLKTTSFIIIVKRELKPGIVPIAKKRCQSLGRSMRIIMGITK